MDLERTVHVKRKESSDAVPLATFIVRMRPRPRRPASDCQFHKDLVDYPRARMSCRGISATSVEAVMNHVIEGCPSGRRCGGR